MLPGGKQLGGAPANFAYHAKCLGARGGLVTRVGDDPPGWEIITRLEELLDAYLVSPDPDYPTGSVSVTLDATGIPNYVIHENVAWDFIDVNADKIKVWVEPAAVVCFGTLAQRSPRSREAIRQMVDATSRLALRVFDVNLRQNYYDADVIGQSLARANVLKLNVDELPVVARLLGLGGSEGDVIDALLAKYSLRLLVLTRGDKGSSLYAPAAQDHHPGVKADLVDTVGAGDAFTAAVAIGLLRNEPLSRINAAANRLAAHVCSQPGATPPIPAELRASLWEAPR
jgi:fructokinase